MAARGEYPVEGDYDGTAPRERRDAHAEGHTEKKSWMNSYWDDMMNEEMDTNQAPVLLPWRIGLFLLTSTITQNMSYNLSTYVSANAYTTWTPAQASQFSSLVYNMIYLGPIFGLGVDFARVFRERFRPVIIIACLINAVLCFACYGDKTIQSSYHGCLMLGWLMEVVTMFIYMPMNGVVINYGNRIVESSGETSARIGGLMAQAMVWRTVGSLVYSIFYELAATGTHPKLDIRQLILIAAILSIVLIVQVLLLTKRHYYTDRRRVTLMTSEPVIFFRDAVELGKKAVSSHKEAVGGKFMFILCFTFIYFMVPDALYNTLYTFEAKYTGSFSHSLSVANSILSALGAVLGSVAYALWMFLAQHSEASHGRMYRANPFIICLAGCTAWSFATFVHSWGEMGSTNPHFNYKVFIPIESCINSALLRFAFMPTLSLAAMQAPRFYETAAFQLFSVCTTGGGVVSSAVTTSFMSSLGVTATKGYWKALLLFMFFQFVPMVIAPTLPKFRAEEALPESQHDKDVAGEDDEREELRAPDFHSITVGTH